ncbi:RNA polymerase sigma factor [Streptomyces avermitilis]|uniref:RNA polymerase sigma factor n=1 Tax=Streptomyces avermitilis TaxID=33903 RepID=UPI0033FEA6C3
MSDDIGAETPPWADAVREAFTEYGDDLLRKARGRLRRLGIPESVHSPEDVVQDAFLAALRLWPGIRNPRSWLERVVWQQCQDISDGQRRTVPAQSEGLDTAHPVLWSSLGPQNPVDVEVETAQVLEAILRLPPAQRAQAFQRLFLGWSYARISEEAGCGPSASRGVVFRATTAVREALSGFRGNRHGLPLRRSDLAAVGFLSVLLSVAAGAIGLAAGLPVAHAAAWSLALLAGLGLGLAVTSVRRGSRRRVLRSDTGHHKRR